MIEAGMVDSRATSIALTSFGIPVLGTGPEPLSVSGYRTEARTSLECTLK